MDKYRIVYNGLNYRIQWLGKTFIFRRPKWYWFKKYTYAGDYIAQFSSREKAHRAIIQNIIEDCAKKQGYVPI